MKLDWSDEFIYGIHDKYRCHAKIQLGSIIGNYDNIGEVIALYFRIDGEGWVNTKPTSYKLVIRSKHENGFPIHSEENIKSLRSAKRIAHDKLMEFCEKLIEELTHNVYGNACRKD